MKIRHYNTWINEGTNWWVYGRQYRNPLARLQADGYSVYYEGEEILYTKEDVLSIIEQKHTKTCEFVYLFAGHYAGGYTVFSKSNIKKNKWKTK